MAKREFLQLCQSFDSKKHHIAGWYMSEKLDGMRCYWDGGITRGLKSSEVPFSNTTKDGRYVNTLLATGLWSRYGKPIQAPDWFLDQLPALPLDGELYMGIGRFQETMSTVKQLEPDNRWSAITYKVIDAPAYSVMFEDGKINVPNFKKDIKGVLPWVMKRLRGNEFVQPKDFESTYRYLCALVKRTENMEVHMQLRLPFTTGEARQHLDEYLNAVLYRGGEGIVLRNPIMPWRPERTHHSLKYKPYTDSEGTVAGYVWGRETDKGSKLLGLMGAMIINWNGVMFELSGFTDEERILAVNGTNYIAAQEVGKKNPGKIVGKGIWNPKFPIGSKVTFKYRELTDDKKPKEARFLRKYDDC